MLSKKWTVRYCEGHGSPQVVFTDDTYSGLCAECEREYGELCRGCEDGTAYPELDRRYCATCAEGAAFWEGLGREAYLREEGARA
jgi:hypothetical protein